MIESIGTTSMSQIGSMRMGQRPTEQEKFDELDVDGSGTLDETELQAMIERMTERMGEEAPSPDEALSRLDVDGSGTVDLAEFEAGRPQGPPPGPPPGGEDASSATTTVDDLQSSLLEMLFSLDEDSGTTTGVLA